MPPEMNSIKQSVVRGKVQRRVVVDHKQDGDSPDAQAAVRIRVHRAITVPRFALILLVASSFAAVWLPAVLTVSGTNLRANQVVLAVIGVTWGARQPTLSRFVLVPGARALLLLVGAFMVQTLLFSDPLGPALAQAALVALNVAAYIFTCALVRKDQASVESALKCMAVCTIMVAAWTAFLAIGARSGWSVAEQFIFLEQMSVVDAGDVVTQSVPRLWNATIGGSLFAALAVTAFVLGVSERRARMLWLLTAGAALVGVATSAARGPLVALGVGAVVFFALSIREPGRIFRLVVIIFVVVLSLRFVLTQDPTTRAILGALEGRAFTMTVGYDTGTAADRLEAWAGMWKDIESNPFVGRGALTYRQYFPVDHPASENFPLEVVHSAGIAGGVALVVCFGGAIRRGWQWSRKGIPAHRRTVGALLAGFCALLVASATNPVAWTGLFWVLLALLASATRIAQVDARTPDNE